MFGLLLLGIVTKTYIMYDFCKCCFAAFTYEISVSEPLLLLGIVIKMLKTDAEIEFEAGVILGELQNKGFGPQDTVATLICLSAFMIERNRRPNITQKEALDHWVNMLREYVNGTN